MKRVIAATVVASIGLSGCCWFQPEAKLPANAIRDTRVFVGASKDDCPSTGGDSEALAAIASAIAVPVIEALTKEAVTALGNAIDEAAKDQEKTVVAVAAAQDIAKTRCLVVIRGVFGTGKTTSTDGLRGDFYNRIGLIADPDLYVEMPVVANSDRAPTAFRLEMQTLDYRRPLLDGLTERRDLVVAVVFQTPSKKSEKDDNAAFAVGGIAVSEVPAGSLLTRSGALRGGKTTAWMPFAKGSEPRASANVSGQTEEEKKAATQAAAQKSEREPGSGEAGIGPYSVFVSVSETRQGSKFMKFLSGVFKPAADAIAKESAKVIVDLSGLKKG